MIIEESNDIDALTIDQLHEQHMTIPVIEEQALKVTHDDRSKRVKGPDHGGFCR